MFPSSKDEVVDLYFGVVNSKYLLVVANRVEKTLVTVRKMRDKEKKAYIEEVSHEKERNKRRIL